MKVKTILRFYFWADSLEKAYENLISATASNPAGDGIKCAEKICDLIFEKYQLSLLWDYLDGIMGGLSDGERAILKEYAALRGAFKSEDISRMRLLKSSQIKLIRRARRLKYFAEPLKIVMQHYCLILPDGS